eukprot:TRINITY_DN6301_c0_g1_i1.p1 TRINITY_DN6301_c0_g1~~TRINITY_DN6301_c0_g1_i1.p1  ORF type:complete len:195 (+),score=27.58 TRINITY_DN6301_c0_g1_i1:90-674(+)
MNEEEKEPLSVVIATAEHSKYASDIAHMVNLSFGYNRISEGEVRGRLAHGDLERPNRVLHVAFQGSHVVGCASSTLQAPWTPYGCGHWGLLVVDKASQGQGIASRIVAAAEKRLHDCGCQEVQIEFEYWEDDEYSDRLKDWYEGKCGFECISSTFELGLIGFVNRVIGKPGKSFRRCRKTLPPGDSSKNQIIEL